MSAEPGSVLPRQKHVLRSWLVLVTTLVLYFTSLKWVGPFINTEVTQWTARMTAWILWVLGADGVAHGRVVTSSIFSFNVIGECTAVHPAAFFCASVVAYPCRWKSKWLGVALGLPSIVVVNQIRLVSLCYVGHWFPDALDAAHMIVWQSALVLFIVCLWLVWALTIADRP